MLINTIKHLVNLGTKQDAEPSFNENIKLTNQVTLLMIFAASLFIFVFSFWADLLTILGLALSFSTLCLTLFIQSTNRHILAKNMLVLNLVYIFTFY